MKRDRWCGPVWVLWVAVMLLGVSCDGNPLPRPEVCPGDEKGFSFAVVGGNRGKLENGASCFGFGTINGPGGEFCQERSAPRIWEGEQIHRDRRLFDTSQYYREEAMGGKDRDRRNGIEQFNLVFYAGHGGPNGWSSIGGHAWLDEMKLGDGRLRYLLMCSCNTMAHGCLVRDPPEGGSKDGPMCATSETEIGDYRQPETFGGINPDTFIADSALIRNVFFRWRDVLGEDFRLACGGSSTLCASGPPNVTNAFWVEYTDGCRDVADSFIEGFGPKPEVPPEWAPIPLCIARGDRDPTRSPLYDRRFMAKPEETNGEFIHIQYPVLLSVGMRRKVQEGPKESERFFLPILKLRRGRVGAGGPVERPVSLAAEFPGLFSPRFIERGHLWIWETPTAVGWRHKASGSIYVRSRLARTAKTIFEDQRLDLWAIEEIFSGVGERFFDALRSLDKPSFEVSSIVEMRIDSTPYVTRAQEQAFVDLARYRKGIEVRGRRFLSTLEVCGRIKALEEQERCRGGMEALGVVNENVIPVVGDGGRLAVEVAGGEEEDGGLGLGPVVGFQIVARPTLGTNRPLAEVKPFADAVREARRSLSEASLDVGDEPLWWILGYKEEGPNCDQGEMWLVYQFLFPPAGASRSVSSAPIFVEIPGQLSEDYPERACTEAD